MPAKINQLSNLDLSFVPKKVLTDKLWKHCIELAIKSASKDQRYGALVVSGGEIVGEGWNRLLAKGEPFPFKTTFFLHAERAAIGSALFQLGEDQKLLQGSTVYVTGFLPRERRPLVRKSSMTDKGSCAQCARLYERFGLNVALMTEDGWVRKDAETALLQAQENERWIKESVLTKRQFRQMICL